MQIGRFTNGFFEVLGDILKEKFGGVEGPAYDKVQGADVFYSLPLESYDTNDKEKYDKLLSPEFLEIPVIDIGFYGLDRKYEYPTRILAGSDGRILIDLVPTVVGYSSAPQKTARFTIEKGTSEEEIIDKVVQTVEKFIKIYDQIKKPSPLKEYIKKILNETSLLKAREEGFFEVLGDVLKEKFGLVYGPDYIRESPDLNWASFVIPLADDFDESDKERLEDVLYGTMARSEPLIDIQINIFHETGILLLYDDGDLIKRNIVSLKNSNPEQIINVITDNISKLLELYRNRKSP